MSDLQITKSDGYIPILTYAFTDFMAADHVEDRFTDALQYAHEARERALLAMENLAGTGVVPGLEYKDRNFEFTGLDAPDVSGIEYPDAPAPINIPAFQGEFPNLDTLTAPNGEEITFDEPYIPDLKNRLLQEFLSGLEDPDGTYSPEVEQAIYERARSRREADLNQKKNAAYNDFAKRGFAGPPGALARLLQFYDTEDHREEENLNRDIIKTQADLARQRYEFIVQSGLNLETSLLERARQRATNTLEQSRLQAQQAMDIFNTKLRKAEIHGSLLQSEVALYAEQARMEMLKVDEYKARIQAATSKGELERIKAQIFSELRQAKSDTFRFELEQDRQNMEVAIQKQSHQREIATQVANIAAQLAASALTSVSASASLSGSQSDSASKSYSTGIHRSDSVSTRIEQA